MLVFFVFEMFTKIWLQNKVTDPLLTLEKSARDFARLSHSREDLSRLHYEQPSIHTDNEVQALSEAIARMTNDMRDYAEEMLNAEKRTREVEKENLRLEQEAKANSKIAELTASVTSLLDNMPALTFSKDTHNGKYLACNQLFAEYAHKETPQGVVGLTDYEIFDEVTAAHFVEDDQKALSMDEPYIFYEDVPDAAGNPRQFQTTKLKFTDALGRLCTLGMCVDVSELMSMKRETLKVREDYEKVRIASVTYSHIARALSADYISLYYVDLDTDQYIEYNSDAEHGDLLLGRKGEDFFHSSRESALGAIFRDDQNTFLQAFTKENVLRAMDEHGTFTLTYRLMVNGVPTYMSMKATRMEKNDHHIIIGVNNVDAQMKQQDAAERIKEERITYGRISALSGDFLCIYAVDPVTNHYTEYSATKAYEGLGLSKSGEDFFAQTQTDSRRRLYLEDLDLFLSAMTKENILKEIQRSGVFVLEYRLMLQGIPTYVSLKAAIVEEKDGPQLLIGITNIDAQVKREQEYAYNLSVARNKANRDALTGVKNKHAYVDIEAQLNHQIDERQPVEFAIVVCDVNGLKQINDTQGHQAGDRFIQTACRTICDTFKHSPVFRVGGDEFAIIAQGYDYERIEEMTAKLARINRQNGANGGIVIACGMAKYEGDRSVAAVFERADNRMYENKKMLKSRPNEI